MGAKGVAVVTFPAMGFFDRIARALGFEPPIASREPGPLVITDAARARIAALPPGTSVIVGTFAQDGGRIVLVREEVTDEPRDPALGVIVAAGDAEALRGLSLDWDGRWSARLEMRIVPGETPNPDGRMYEVDRPLARGSPRFFLPGQTNAPDLAVRLLKIEGVASILFRDNTVTVERVPGIGWAPLDRAVIGALREHFLLCGGPIAAPSAVASSDDPLTRRVAVILRDRVAPIIHRDGGDIELVEVRDGVAVVRLIGACRTCPAATATLELGVEKALRDSFPGEVHRVVRV